MAPKILIVDDDLELRELLRYILQRNGYEVLEAESGPEMLAAVPRQRPDLVLLDVMMPGVNGFAVCSALRANPVTQHLPIIMVTARADDQARRLGLSAGANDFITKPVRPADLVARIRSLLGRVERPAT